MNILIVMHGITHLQGGVFDAVKGLFTNKEMPQEKIRIISYKEPDSERVLGDWHGIKISLFENGPFRYSTKVKKEILFSNADILHVEALWRFPHLWMYSWKKKNNRPVVCSPHGMLDPYIIREQGKIKRFIAKLFFQKGLDSVTCFHALCKKEMDDIRAYGLKQPIAIIPNGIDLPKDNYIFEKCDDKKHLLYLGRLHKKKGIDLLLYAVSLLQKDNKLKDWIIDIVGWDHENCEQELKKIVRDGNLEDYVIFHGSKFGREKQEMYAKSDAYILPSHGEGLPMTILEAWSWKCPVIMTSQCNIPEGFEHNAAIEILDNIESVKEGIEKMICMSDRDREAMGKRGFLLVKEHFTWDASAKKMLILYDWLINGGEKPDFVFTS